LIYTKFSPESDVWVFDEEDGFGGTTGKIICGLCVATDHEDVSFPNHQEILTHLHEHEVRGDSVPLKAFERLREEWKKQNGGQPDPTS
jgi:hypothetical protein